MLGENIRLHTANGIVDKRKATVHSVRIGGIEVRNVAGTVDERPSCDKGVSGGNDRSEEALRDGRQGAADHGHAERWSCTAAHVQSSGGCSGGMWSLLLLSLLVVRRTHVGLAARRSWPRAGGHGGAVMGRSLLNDHGLFCF